MESIAHRDLAWQSKNHEMFYSHLLILIFRYLRRYRNGNMHAHKANKFSSIFLKHQENCFILECSQKIVMGQLTCPEQF